VQQERYTRQHTGSGEGMPDLSGPLAELREETDDRRRVRIKVPRAGVMDRHHIVGGEKARPMTVHAPRHKDMDPNHPLNLKKMEPKADEYKPCPPPTGKFFIEII
jgi:hypothetical protein